MRWNRPPLSRFCTVFLALALASSLMPFVIWFQSAGRHRSLGMVDKQPRYLLLENDLPTTSGSPPLAWLLSFPNSGTSLTMELTMKVSNRSVASNYGKEWRDDNGVSVPVYSSVGPPFRVCGSHYHTLPPSYVLTKTHCGGYCSSCHPSRYVLTYEQFARECTRGASAENREKPLHYDDQLVHRIVHLFRNPFDNIVSRFHLSWNRRNHSEREDDQAWVRDHPRTPEGFARWCRYIDQRHAEDDPQYFQPEVYDAGVPCYTEFYRYIAWHNHANTVVQKLGLPVLDLYYERYGNDVEGILDDLFEFLELDQVFEPSVVNLHVSSGYNDHYSPQQKRNIITMLRHLASPTTAKQLEVYLNDTYDVAKIETDDEEEESGGISE